MSQVVEVDQSGRIEFTKDDTVLALSNGKKFSILITSQVKRECIKILRQAGYKGRTFYLKLFNIALFLLLKNHLNSNSKVIIDKEYMGNESLIKSDLLNFFRRAHYNVDKIDISFGLVGKKSPAHNLALTTFQKKFKPNKVISLEEILREFSNKKIGVLKRGSAYLQRPAKDNIR